jgi:hypothetical protein
MSNKSSRPFRNFVRPSAPASPSGLMAVCSARTLPLWEIRNERNADFKTRIHAGLTRARAQGKTLGRPTVDDEKAAAILRSLKEGMRIKKAAAALGCGVGTVLRIRNEASA